MVICLTDELVSDIDARGMVPRLLDIEGVDAKC